MAAAAYAKSATARERTLRHASQFAQVLRDAGVDAGRRAPMLLPEYRGKAALARMIDVW